MVKVGDKFIIDMDRKIIGFEKECLFQVIDSTKTKGLSSRAVECRIACSLTGLTTYVEYRDCDTEQCPIFEIRKNLRLKN